MNQEDLLNVIGEATEEMLERSEKKTVPVKRIVFAAVAACLALVITILLVAPPGDGFHIVGVSQQERDAKAVEEVFACMKLNKLKSEEEFNAFMAENSNKLPKSFVTWEDAGAFGEVKNMCVSDGSTYSYAFVDEDYYLDISYSANLAAYSTVSADTILSTSSGMRKISNNTGNNVMIQRNGYQYEYDRFGDLTWITWSDGGVHFSINCGLLDYPEDKADTLVGKLLSADDSVANAAFAEIKEKLGK